MSWWRRLIKFWRKQPQPRTAFPVSIELVADELHARVHLHTLKTANGPISCWTYITEGLWLYGQKELIFTLRRQYDEAAHAFPDIPLRLFSIVHSFAKQGQHIDSGEFSEFSGSRFLGYKALAYMPIQPIEGLELPDYALTAIALREQELDAVKAFGLTRVLANLGKAYGHYPCPLWCSRRRPDLPLGDTLQNSMLVRMKAINVLGARVCWKRRDNTIELRLPAGSQTFFERRIAQLADDKPWAILTELDPSANGCLVWQSGQNQMSAIAPARSDGIRLSGCFIAFCPQQDEDGGQVFEDGLVITLTDFSWRRVQRALETGKDAVVKASSDEYARFVMRWLAENDGAPDDQPYRHAEGGWEGYRDKHIAGRRGAIEEVILLTGNDELETRIKVQQFTEYLDAIGGAAKQCLDSIVMRSDQRLLLEFDLRPERRVSVRLDPAKRTDIVCQKLRRSLFNVPPPSIRTGSVKFQVIIKL